MRISNKAIGYTSLLALVLLIATVSYCMWKAHQNISYVVTVDFDELGSLQPEDPVVVRGYKVGTVGTVTWLYDRARITVKFDEPLVLREGTQFNNVNFALMGQRRLEVIPAKTGKVMPKDYIFKGHFEPGIAEALRLIEKVNERLITVREAIFLIAEGDSTHKSIPEIFNNALDGVEAFMNNTDKEIELFVPQLDILFNQVNEASKAVGGITEQVDSSVNAISISVREKMASIQSTINDISVGAEKANKIIDKFDSNVVSHELLQTTETLEKVTSIVDKLKKVIAAINTKGIKVYDENGKPVKLIHWENMNIIGDRASDKAKERMEQAEKEKAATQPASSQSTVQPAVQPASSQSSANP